MDTMTEYLLTGTKYLMILLSVIILIRCLRSMFSVRYDPEVWGYMRVGNERIPVNHWENLIGRSRSADIRVDREGVSRVHAVLTRSDHGVWTIYDIFSKGGVWVNGERADDNGLTVEDGDAINLAGNVLRFYDTTPEKRQKLEEKREAAGLAVSPALTLFDLTLFELLLLAQYVYSAARENLFPIALAFGTLILLQLCCYNAMRLMGRSGFEVETLAFYLTALGLAVAASSTPEDMYKQILLILVSVLLFLFGGWWLRSLKRSAVMRTPVAVLALALMALNVLTSESVNGARNWLEVAGYSLQPSELVKVAYIYVGASTLDRLYRRRNLYSYIAFSAACVIALALIGDFGTALIFFATFLVISFMRSGSIATVILAVTGAGLAGFLAVSVKPYIAQRFANWGHVWEDIYDTGFQQTRAMSAAASGALFGKGAGSGWLHNVFAANTDMVFAMICEELGLIIALCSIAAILVLAFFAVRSASRSRSAFYSITACATVSMLLVQLSLNVFGSLDILPFTGVTFPFVSHGGTSLLSCWMLMAFIKGSDTRREGSFAVRPVTAESRAEEDEEEDEYEEDDYDGEDAE